MLTKRKIIFKAIFQDSQRKAIQPLQTPTASVKIFLNKAILYYCMPWEICALNFGFLIWFNKRSIFFLKNAKLT